MKPMKSFLLGAAALAMSTFAATSAFAEVAVLRAVSCFPVGAPPGVLFEELVAEINKRGEGVVQVELLGGAPAIGSPFQVAERMALGAYDIAGCPEAFFGNLVPEAPVLRLADHTYAELRENGGLDYFQELMKAKGAIFLGRHQDDGAFHLFLADPIDRPDLTGLNLRISPVYTAFFKAMGATVQRSTMPEVYTLMENGTVDGFGWSLRGISPDWYKVAHYRVDPGVYHATVHTIANLARWESMSQEARDLVMSVVLEFEAKAEPTSDLAKDLDAKMLATMAENGMKTITFEGADAEKWLAVAKDSAWAEFLQENPETGPKLKELFSKSN
ncbi:TRAP transporter substrate-binding protein DctP [Hoeflea sp. BAL378]|uniref:TRAP transporter substrate-binding protein DctP n=1 Tax=Hoeflea sp. BAL378 TaxID=1547437 RepID=UPI000A777F0E|nr:TRAP transporter substrate-binding protein DctP [Hoeflea sp. BAL378]